MAPANTRLDILTGMSTASQLADEYDSVIAEAIDFAESCSEGDWQTTCPAEQRTVGVLFDHIAVGNPQVVRWVNQFLGDRPVVITPEMLNAQNGQHAEGAAGRPRAETIKDLKESSNKTSGAIRGLTDEQARQKQQFGWAGQQDVAWVASAAVRHPRGHLKSIKDALNR